ncbi:MAG TPA: VWD domain-containing protein [Stenomitos sp.]
MGGIDVFQAQDVSKVAFKPPPPPVEEPEIVQAQDITTTPPPVEDVKQIETGKGNPSEISVVTAGGPTDVQPLPNAGLGDLLGDLLEIGKIITKENDDTTAPSTPSTPKTPTPTTPSTPKTQTTPPKADKPADPPKTEKPKDPPKTEPKKEEKPIPASGRTFKTQGDPIVKTGDGLQYSMNVPGKYISLMSKSGDFKMEQTITKTPGNRHYNTGMDFHVGKNNISFDANGGKNPATMTINGQKVDLKFTAFSKTLDDGTKLSYDPKTNKIDITSPQGDHITVQRAWNDQKTHYLNATVELSDKRPAGSVYGALGTLDADDNAANDARMRDGSVYKGPIGDLWKTPEDFLKEWRV